MNAATLQLHRPDVVFARLEREIEDVARHLLGRVPSTRRSTLSLENFELESAHLSSDRATLVARFLDGREYTLPLATLRLSSPVVEAAVDDLRHGIALRLRDGTITDVSSGFVLYHCDPGYRAENESSELSRSAVAARIRALRKQSGRRASEVAAAAGLAPSNYARLEAGKHQPRIETLLSVAKALRVPLVDLLRA